MEAYMAAYQYLPDRAGPLYRVAMHYQAKGEYHLSHLFLARAMAIPAPGPNRLFLEHTIYDYQLPLEFAVACYYVRDHSTAIEANSRLLRSGKLAAHAIDQVVRNRRFSLDALFPKQAGAPGPAGRMIVMVVSRDAGPELDDCVDSLAAQTAPFEAVLI